MPANTSNATPAIGTTTPTATLPDVLSPPPDGSSTPIAVLLELEEELVDEPVDEAVPLGPIVKYSIDVIVVAGLVPDGAWVTMTVLAGTVVEVRRVVEGAWLVVGISCVVDVVAGGGAALDVGVVIGVVVDDGSGAGVGVGVGVGVGSGSGVEVGVVTGAGGDVVGSLGAVVGVVVSVGALVVGWSALLEVVVGSALVVGDVDGRSVVGSEPTVGLVAFDMVNDRRLNRGRSLG